MDMGSLDDMPNVAGFSYRNDYAFSAVFTVSFQDGFSLCLQVADRKKMKGISCVALYDPTDDPQAVFINPEYKGGWKDTGFATTGITQFDFYRYLRAVELYPGLRMENYGRNHDINPFSVYGFSDLCGYALEVRASGVLKLLRDERAARMKHPLNQVFQGF